MRTCIVIPHHNHPDAIGGVVASLKLLALPCLIVDDGSDPRAHEVVARIAEREDWVTLLRLDVNQGKGGAVMAGFDALLAQGFTHALQIDADGQHHPADVPQLLELSRRHPESVVTGYAVYDDSVPRARLYGRYLTHVWVWINTLSLRIRDSMCGLRLYPLAPTCAIWRRSHVGRRMDFDMEILVRLSWSGADIINVPARVTYPADGVSHFKVFRDNVLISAMHTRMFFGMLWRLPRLLGRKFGTRPRKVEA